ncbi:MAG TPA: hypothetical protein VL027_09930 [Spongiibacteraceae bacterium]|nr:hypothetical protein [Spongiibacteraceae bacterium]
MSSDLVVMAVSGALLLVVFAAILVRRRYRQRLERLAQTRALCRSAEQLLGIARAIAPLLDDYRAVELMLTMAAKAVDHAHHQNPNDPGVNRGITALNELTEGLPRQLGSAALPLVSEEQLAAANLQFVEAQRAVSRAERHAILPESEAQEMIQHLAWRLLQLGVDCHSHLAATAMSRNDKSAAHEHYRQALLLLRKSTDTRAQRHDLMRRIRATLDELEATSSGASLISTSPRSGQSEH